MTLSLPPTFESLYIDRSKEHSFVRKATHALKEKRGLPTPQGPATAKQGIVAAAINEQIRHLRSDLSVQALSIHMRDLPDPPATLISQTQRRSIRFQEMSDAELGSYLRQAGPLFLNYINEQASPSAPLLEMASRVFSSAVTHMASGGKASARRAIAEVHQEFDESLLLAFNGELTIVRGELEAQLETERLQLADLAEQAALEVSAEAAALEVARQQLAADRAAFEEEKALLIATADTASAEASEARRLAKQAKEDTQAAEERHRKNSEFNRNKAAAEVREARERLNGAQEALGSVHAECKALAAQLAAVTAERDALLAQQAEREQLAQQSHALTLLAEATTAQEHTMFKEFIETSTSTAAVAFAVWLRAQGHQTVTAHDKERRVVCPTATAAEYEAFCREYPSKAAQQALVVRAIRERKSGGAAA